MRIEENLHYSLLLDMYSPLLTDKQSSVLDSFFNHNLGLSEIASLHGISRQGVRDAIERGKIALDDYESRLHLLARMDGIKCSITALCQSIKEDMDRDKIVDELCRILDLV